MKRFRRLSFLGKTFTGMIAASVIPMLGGYLLLLQVLNLTYRNHLNREAESTLAIAEESMTEAFSDIFRAIGRLSEDEGVVQFLDGDREGVAEDVYRKLYAASGECGSYAGFSIYDSEGLKKMTMTDNKYVSRKLSLNWNILYRAARHPGEYVVCNARLYEGEKRVEYLRVGRTVQGADGGIKGYVIATIVKDNFDNMLKGLGKEKEGVIYVMDDFREIVYLSSESYTEEVVSAGRALFKMEPPCRSMEKDSYYYLDYNEDCSLYIMYRQPTAFLNRMKQYVLGIAVLSGGIGVAACLCLSYYFSRLIYKPIRRMQDAIGEIKRGNYETHIEVGGDDELGQLTESFNVMSKHLIDNTERLIQRERELSDSNIKMMQAQLNPHFLYNTLDTLKWMAKENEMPELVSMSSNLAQILRMSISAKPIIRLSQEVALVEAYAEIQKIRFADKFELIVDIPEELEDCMLPKLTLQPLVENAIIHGLAECEAGTVLVQASAKSGVDGTDAEETDSGSFAAEGGILRIMVQDDGSGMTAEEVKRLNETGQTAEGETPGHESIGYNNVDAIIRLHYGEQYGLYVESEKDVGTRVYLTIPLSRKG